MKLLGWEESGFLSTTELLNCLYTSYSTMFVHSASPVTESLSSCAFRALSALRLATLTLYASVTLDHICSAGCVVVGRHGQVLICALAVVRRLSVASGAGGGQRRVSEWFFLLRLEVRTLGRVGRRSMSRGGVCAVMSVRRGGGHSVDLHSARFVRADPVERVACEARGTASHDR